MKQYAHKPAKHTSHGLKLLYLFGPNQCASGGCGLLGFAFGNCLGEDIGLVAQPPSNSTQSKSQVNSVPSSFVIFWQQSQTTWLWGGGSVCSGALASTHIATWPHSSQAPRLTNIVHQKASMPRFLPHSSQRSITNPPSSQSPWRPSPPRPVAL